MIRRHDRPKRSLLRSVGAILMLAAAGAAHPAYADQGRIPPAAADQLAPLTAEYPATGFAFTPAGRLTSVYGPAFSFGDSAVRSAAAFAGNHSGIFGVPAADLVPGSTMTDSGLTQQVYFERDTGQYRFTLVYYSQVRDSLPVFRADLRLLTRNEPGFPLVLAKSALRDLGDFHVAPDWQTKAFTLKAAQDSVRSRYPGLINYGASRTVIWAGYDDQMAAPRVAYEFTADNAGAGAPSPMSQLFVVDARNGAILYSESQILNVDVSGTVRAVTTDGIAADACGPESSRPCPTPA